MDELFDKVEKVAREILERAELPEDSMEAEKKRIVFINHLKKFNWTKGREGEPVILDETETPLRDAHGWDLTPKDIVKQEYDKFFTDSDLPQTRQEFEAELKDKRITPERRVKITRYWKGKHPEDFSEPLRAG